MKRILLIFITLMSCIIFGQEKQVSKKQKTTKVFICNSFTSKTYHKQENCKGLKKCKDTIVRVSLHKAKNYGRVLCGYEKKKDK